MRDENVTACAGVCVGRFAVGVLLIGFRLGKGNFGVLFYCLASGRDRFRYVMMAVPILGFLVFQIGAPALYLPR